MHKSISNLESDMRSVLLELVKSSDHDAFVTSLKDNRNIAICTCVENHYVENLSFWPMSGGYGVFNNHGNIYITEAGLRFLHDTSPLVKVGHAVLYVLKGATGYFLGILSSVLADLIVLAITGEEIMTKILQFVSRFLP